MSFIISIAIKLTIGFTALVLFMNFNGKGQLAPLSTGDQIGNYVLGGIIGGVIYNPAITIVQFLIVLLIWGVLMTAINFLKTTSTGVKNIIDGQVISLVKNGQIITENFTKASMTVADFYTKVRMKGVYKVSDIEGAFLESNGQITVIKKEDEYGLVVIAEGKVQENNLLHSGKNLEWVMEKLGKKGIKNIEGVFLAEISNDDLFIVHK